MSAAKLATGQGPIFDDWLLMVTTELKREWEWFANDLTPAQVQQRLAKSLRLLTRLRDLLAQSVVYHWLEIQPLLANNLPITREYERELRQQLDRELNAIPLLESRLACALADLQIANEFRYFGSKSAEQPHIDMLVVRVWRFWTMDLRRRPTISNDSDFVVFTQVVLSRIAQRNIGCEAVRKRLKVLAKAVTVAADASSRLSSGKNERQ